MIYTFDNQQQNTELHAETSRLANCMLEWEENELLQV
jgi:hypothetical protein